jgi:hypothetical protein
MLWEGTELHYLVGNSTNKTQSGRGQIQVWLTKLTLICWEFNETTILKIVFGTDPLLPPCCMGDVAKVRTATARRLLRADGRTTARDAFGSIVEDGILGQSGLAFLRPYRLSSSHMRSRSNTSENPK